jgi:hypothetical protein
VCPPEDDPELRELPPPDEDRESEPEEEDEPELRDGAL